MTDKRQLPPLNALISFDMVARTQHFTQAADILCVSNSAVSQSIKHLEEMLEVKLVERSPKGVSLTEAGQRYHKQIEPALSRIEIATSALIEDENQLNLSLMNSLSLKWFIPKLAKLQIDEPDIDIRLSTGAFAIDFNRENLDLAITLGKTGDWPDCEEIKLMDHQLIVVGRPEHTDGMSFEEILESDLPLIQIDNFLHQDDWQKWFASSGYKQPKDKETLHFKTTIQALSAIKNFPAVGIFSNQLILEDLKRNSLQQVDSFELDPQSSYYIIHPKFRKLKPSAQRLIDWLMEHK